MAKFVILCLCSLLACIAGQRITTIQLDGVQYFISRMNPYSPELNYFLAYQYCRSLGLQLASFETKEKVESMTQYLQNAGYSKYDFWTSGNRLGTGMFLWMSTGLPFNATFDFFENLSDATRAGLLDPVDHNSNTAPQRTARDSNSGLEKGCVMLKAPTLKWMPEDCSTVKDFICEQTRCYYYNYGSIPVSSAQGRPITSTTTQRTPLFSTTPLPLLKTTTAKFPTFFKKSPVLSFSSSSTISSSSSSSSAEATPAVITASIKNDNNLQSISSELSKETLFTSSSPSSSQQDKSIQLPKNNEKYLKSVSSASSIPASISSTIIEQNNNVVNTNNGNQANIVSSIEAREDIDNNNNNGDEEILENDENDESRNFHEDEDNSNNSNSANNDENQHQQIENDNEELESLEQEQDHIISESQSQSSSSSSSSSLPSNEQSNNDSTHIEERIKQISQEIEKLGNTNHDNSDIGHQSFLSLSDLIKTLRPNDKKIPQIDSDYSNTMRVLGESSSFVTNNNNNDDSKIGISRSLFQ